MLLSAVQEEMKGSSLLFPPQLDYTNESLKPMANAGFVTSKGPNHLYFHIDNTKYIL